MIRQLQLLVIAVGCLIAAPILLIRSATSLPELAELEQVEGDLRLEIGSRGTRRRTSYPVLRLGQHATPFAYLDWFPNSSELARGLQQGVPAKIWSDRGGNDWVWQIEQDGNIVVAYADVRAAIEHNNRFDVWFGIGAFGLSLAAAWMLRRVRRAHRRQTALAG